MFNLYTQFQRDTLFEVCGSVCEMESGEHQYYLKNQSKKYFGEIPEMKIKWLSIQIDRKITDSYIVEQIHVYLSVVKVWFPKTGNDLKSTTTTKKPERGVDL